MQYKLRYIVGSKLTPKKVQGITIPDEIALFFEGCFFSIQKSGTCIVLYSGNNLVPTKQEVENFTFQDCRT